MTSRRYSRLAHLRTLWSERVVGKWLAGAWVVYGVLAAIRSEFLPATQQDEFQAVKALALLLSLPLVWWVAGTFVLIAIWLFESSYSGHKKVEVSAEVLKAEVSVLEEKLRPKFALSFHPEAEGIAKTPTRISHPVFGSPQIVTKEFMATYVRIRVTASSETAVVGCRAFLTKLERESVFGETTSNVALPHSISLKGAESFDVHPGVICATDFLVCSSQDNKLRVPPDCEWPLALNNIFDETGTYHFTITVNGDGISDSIKVAVGWPGQWDKITARQVMPSRDSTADSRHAPNAV